MDCLCSRVHSSEKLHTKSFIGSHELGNKIEHDHDLWYSGIHEMRSFNNQINLGGPTLFYFTKFFMSAPGRVHLTSFPPLSSRMLLSSLSNELNSPCIHSFTLMAIVRIKNNGTFVQLLTFIEVP